MVSVCVLMSVYNGERFLREQLDSIAAQEGVDVTIIARDDRSTDNSREILRPRVARLIEGTNIGAARSYLELLEAVPECDLVAFADQDDVWKPEKLRVAVERLATHDSSRPLLYCSALEYVDEALRPAGTSRVPRVVSFENALVENIAVGCTVVINRKARDLAIRCTPESLVMHDAWLYLLVSAFGIVDFDPTPHILYRQHGTNAVGASSSRIAHFAIHFRRLVQQKRFGFARQASAFLRCFGDELPAGLRKALVSFAEAQSFPARLRYALTGAVVRQSAVDALFARALIAAGRL